MHRSIILLVVLAVLVGLLAGCPPKQTQSVQAPATDPAKAAGTAGGTVPASDAPAKATGEVKLYVPCGMIIPVRAVMDEFEKRNPDCKIKGTFDNGGVLVKRITKKGEKPDAFLSAGWLEMGQLEKAGKVDTATKQALGDFELVCITSSKSKLSLTKPEDLKKCKTFSMPNPDLNSVGASGKQTLTKLGLYAGLKGKTVLTEHAIQSHAMVASGKSDAGISYRNCPLDTAPDKLAKSKVKIAFSFPRDSYEKQQVLIAVMKDAANPEAAKAFVDFMASPDGLKIMGEKGMTGCEVAPTDAEAPEGQASAAGAVTMENAVVKVRAFYPGNEGHVHIRKMVEALPAKYPGKVASEFIAFDSDEGYKKFEAAGLTCGTILINDKAEWTYLKDGKPVDVTFTKAMGGEWNEADLYACIEQAIKEAGG